MSKIACGEKLECHRVPFTIVVKTTKSANNLRLMKTTLKHLIFTLKYNAVKDKTTDGVFRIDRTILLLLSECVACSSLW